MKSMIRTAVVLSSSWLLAACGMGSPGTSVGASSGTPASNPVPVMDWGDPPPPGDGLNGPSLNGEENGLVGSNPDGSSLGKAIQSVTLSSTRFGNTPLQNVALNGLKFTGTFYGAPVQGYMFNGVTFTATTDNGSPLTVRIDSVDHEAPPDDDVWSYDVSYRDPSTGSWYPACPDPANGGQNEAAVPLLGYWNYDFGTVGGGGKTASTTQFTFACKDLGAIGKCIQLGYAPWRTVNGVSLDAHHQACVRMIRADFCGNGTSYTKEGNVIDLYDDIGIQSDDQDWSIEAEWTPDGAACFVEPNRADTIGISSVPCYDPSKSVDCGDLAHFQSGTLLMDELGQ